MVTDFVSMHSDRGTWGGFRLRRLPKVPARHGSAGFTPIRLLIHTFHVAGEKYQDQGGIWYNVNPEVDIVTPATARITYRVAARGHSRERRQSCCERIFQDGTRALAGIQTSDLGEFVKLLTRR